MSKLKFLGAAAALLLLAGCGIPLGYGGYGGYGGNGGYGGYNGYGASPYGSSYPAPQYGYPYGNNGGAPYYGYPSGPVASGPPVIIDNQVPVPVYPNNSSTYGAYGTTTPNGNWQAYHRHRRHRDQNNQETPGTTTGTDPTLTPGTNSPDSATASLNRRQRQWNNQLANQQGTQVPQRQGFQGPQLGNLQGSPYRTQSQMANQQTRMRAPMTAPNMTRSMTRQNSGAVMAAPRPSGTTAMRAPQRAPQAQQSGSAQRRVRPGI